MTWCSRSMSIVSSTACAVCRARSAAELTRATGFSNRRRSPSSRACETPSSVSGEPGSRVSSRRATLPSVSPWRTRISRPVIIRSSAPSRIDASHCAASGIVWWRSSRNARDRPRAKKPHAGDPVQRFERLSDRGIVDVTDAVDEEPVLSRRGPCRPRLRQASDRLHAWRTQQTPGTAIPVRPRARTPRTCGRRQFVAGGLRGLVTSTNRVRSALEVGDVVGQADEPVLRPGRWVSTRLRHRHRWKRPPRPPRWKPSTRRSHSADSWSAIAEPAPRQLDTRARSARLPRRCPAARRSKTQHRVRFRR